MEIFVREFAEADREELRRLFVASRNAAFSWASPEAHQPADFDASTREERVLVAVVEGRLAGFASIWEPDSFLHNVFVDPAFVRRGVGKALLDACEPYFAGTPSLKCLQANVAARDFYLSQDWRVESEGESAEGNYLLMVKPDRRQA